MGFEGNRESAANEGGRPPEALFDWSSRVFDLDSNHPLKRLQRKVTPMPSLTRRETRILQGLAPHTRAHALQLMYEVPLLRPTSGRRSHTLNRRVGGSPTSWHLKGRAVDFVGPTWDLGRAAGLAWALRMGAGCTGPEEVLLEDLGRPNQHLHVAW